MVGSRRNLSNLVRWNEARLAGSRVVDLGGW